MAAATVDLGTMARSLYDAFNTREFDRGAAMVAADRTRALIESAMRPAIDRGGLGEFLGIAALFIAILLGERWLRSR